MKSVSILIATLALPPDHVYKILDGIEQNDVFWTMNEKLFYALAVYFGDKAAVFDGKSKKGDLSSKYRFVKTDNHFEIKEHISVGFDKMILFCDPYSFEKVFGRESRQFIRVDHSPFKYRVMDDWGYISKIRESDSFTAIKYYKLMKINETHDIMPKFNLHEFCMIRGIDDGSYSENLLKYLMIFTAILLFANSPYFYALLGIYAIYMAVIIRGKEKLYSLFVLTLITPIIFIYINSAYPFMGFYLNIVSVFLFVICNYLIDSNVQWSMVI